MERECANPTGRHTLETSARGSHAARCPIAATLLQAADKGGTMTVLDRVRGLVERLGPASICDDCITEKLGLSVRQHANHKARELAGGGGFERRKDACSICGETRIVIRRAPK
jgi:ribosomal protein L34E